MIWRPINIVIKSIRDPHPCGAEINSQTFQWPKKRQRGEIWKEECGIRIKEPQTNHNLIKFVDGSIYNPKKLIWMWIKLFDELYTTIMIVYWKCPKYISTEKEDCDRLNQCWEEKKWFHWSRNNEIRIVSTIKPFTSRAIQ